MKGSGVSLVVDVESARNRTRARDSPAAAKVNMLIRSVRIHRYVGVRWRRGVEAPQEDKRVKENSSTRTTPGGPYADCARKDESHEQELKYQERKHRNIEVTRRKERANASRLPRTEQPC
jgi:hypothetical protein